MDIAEVFAELGVSYLMEGHHHCRSGWLQLDCPHCGPRSGKYHLGYNLQGQYFNCWKCGGKRSVPTLALLGNVSEKEAVKLWKGLDKSATLPASSKQAAGRLTEPPGRGSLQRAHKRYLRGRGFRPDVISDLWQIEGIGVGGRLSWRIYIPIYHAGQRVSWTTRAIGDKVESKKYLSARAQDEVHPHKHLVYGYDYCRHSVVVVEGPMDAWRVGPGAGALFGTNFTHAQALLLSKIPRRFICFDQGSAAQGQARALAELLSVLPGHTEVIELDAKDPGSAEGKEIRLLRKVAGL